MSGAFSFVMLLEVLRMVELMEYEGVSQLSTEL
jgi:hypothetical protein